MARAGGIAGVDRPIDPAEDGCIAPAGDGDDDASQAALERGRVLFAQPCRLVISAARIEQIPADTLPEVAFAGRSNVGKSSLINALTGRTALARTSNTPGRTQQLNFFDLGGRLMLTDLPGYGFAQAPKARVAAWTRLIEDYLRGRQPLRRTLLLIDARHGLKDVDRAVLTLLDRSAVPAQVVLTKSDKVTDAARAATAAAIIAELARHPAAHPQLHATSARTGDGIAALRADLSAFDPVARAPLDNPCATAAPEPPS